MSLPPPDLSLHGLFILSLLGILSLWMKSDLPILCTRLFRVISNATGLQKDKQADWPDDIEYKFWIRSQWSTWLHQRCKETALGRAWAHLLSCHYCLGFHMSWAAGLAMLALPGVDGTQALYCLTYPASLYALYKLT